jgi:hypothetical protein
VSANSLTDSLLTILFLTSIGVSAGSELNILAAIAETCAAEIDVPCCDE